MKRKLKKYTKQRLRRIRRYLNAYAAAPDHEILHKLRLEIKKLRALLKMLHYQNAKFDQRKIFVPFKEIFKACGAIRDPYVMRTLSEKFTGEAFPSATENPRRIRKFTKRAPEYIEQLQSIEKPFLREVKHVNTRSYRKYVKQKKQWLKRRLFPDFKKKQLHSSRRSIKDIGYLLDITKKKKTIHPFYDHASDIIGEWHDKRVLLNRLQDMDAFKPELREELQKRSKEDLVKLKAQVKRFYR